MLGPITACITSGNADEQFAIWDRRSYRNVKEKKILKEKAQKAAKIRGVGVGSRQKFVLAANWREEPYKSSDRERGVRKRVSYVSPGKTKYWS